MQPAEDLLQPDLCAAAWSTPRIPIYVNVDAEPVGTSDAACSALVRQVSRPVRWQQTIERMLADGVTLFVEIGPGRVLVNMIKRIAKEVERVSVESPSDVDAARSAIAKHQ
jgi:[acyl-carrier-protein] S-malonyltransferase